MLIEYAMILAFVIVTGVVFVSDNSFSSSIGNIFNSTTDVLDKASGQDKRIDFGGFRDKYCWTSVKERFDTGSVWDGGFTSKNLVQLNPGTYEISFDYDKFKSIMGDAQDYSKMEFLLMGYSVQDGKNTALVLDSDSPDKTKGYHDTYVTTKKPVVGEDGIPRYTFENKGETINFGVNFRKNGVSFDGKDKDVLDKAINESLSITKK